MRITSLSYANSMMETMNRNQQQFARLQSQIGSLSRILKPSDDPIAVAQINQIQREQASLDLYQKNISRLQGSLRGQETNVTSVQNEIQAMLDNLGEALGGTLSAEEIVGYGQDLAAMQETVISLLNSKNEEGRYLFGGSQSQQPPVVFDEVSEQWVWQGNNESPATMVANGVSFSSGTNLVETFGAHLETLNQLQAIGKKMQDTTLDPASYRQEMQAVHDLLDQTHGKQAALLTDLGNRQRSLEMWNDTHQDNAIANQDVVNKLQQLNLAEASTSLSLYFKASEAAQKSYLRIEQLSLFGII